MATKSSGELCSAARAGNTKLALSLIKQGADVNYDPPMGTPLENAVRVGSVEIIRALIKAGADINHQSYLGSVLVRAVEAKQVAAAEELIRAGVDVNLKPKIGSTALMLAVKGNNSQFVELLLRHGANPNLKDGASVGEYGEPEVRIEGGCRITHMEDPEYVKEITPLILAIRQSQAGITA